MLRGLRIPALALLVLALAGGRAHAAVTYDFTVTPGVPNEDQVTTFSLTPESAELDRVWWDLDGDGEFEDGFTRQVQRVYADPGPVTVRMRAREDNGEPFQIVTKTITVNAAPTPDFDQDPASPLEDQQVAFSARATDPEGDAVSFAWRFGDGETATGPAPSHAYEEPGTYDLVLTAVDEHGAFSSKTVELTVAPDPGPSAGFGFAPAAPLTGDTVTFTSTSTASQGSITELDWDLDGDGDFDDAEGPTATWTYSSPGTRVVQLRVEQENGRVSFAFADVTVSDPPPPPPQPPPPPPPQPPPPPPAQPESGQPASADPVVGGSEVIVLPRPPAKRLVPMRPFPVVRIAGVVLPRGADVRLLSVRAPRGSRVLVRCRGRGCPTGSVARTSATRLVRLRRFERRLRAGISLELFVRKAGTIGKYTRFRIRAGRPPARVDRCLRPGSARPVRCP